MYGPPGLPAPTGDLAPGGGRADAGPVPPAPTSARPRLAVVGARRARSGVGGWLARHLAAAGAEIAAVVGSRLVTALEAAEALAPDLGHRPIPLAHADDLERLPDLAGLVIASPHETHEAWLRWAVGRGLHVLCEKPLVWGGEGAPLAAAACARRFAQRGLHLVVNAQHPWSLPAFFALHPEVRPGAVTRLEVALAPPSRGLAMLPDALPHALSLLHALAPDPEGRVEPRSAAWGDDEGRSLALRFAYHGAGRAIEVDVALEEGGPPPRPMRLALDGRSATRRVEAAGYALRYEDQGRSVPLPDPMAALCRDFLRRLTQRAAPTPDPSAVPGVAQLACLAASVPAPRLTEIAFP